MAHVTLNETKWQSREVAEPVRRIRVELDRLKARKAVMIQMLNGADSGVAANFATVASEFGVEGSDQTAKNVAAKLMFDELNSTLGNVAALEQFLAILG
jgi:hypothetical protein